MPRRIREIQIFLSSPGDVAEQREIVTSLIERLSHDPLIAEHFRISVVAWDTAGSSVPLSANQTPQASVNEYLAWPRDCDLTIVLLWGRIGTRLPKTMTRPDGSSFQSGTVWELEDARTAGKPVWIYRKIPPPEARIDDATLEDKRRQFQALDEFLRSSRDVDESIVFGLQEFDSNEKLAALVAEHLRHFIARILRAPAVNDAADEAAAAAVAATGHEPRSVRQLASGRASGWAKELVQYPIGPMVRDIEVRYLAEAMAELNQAEDTRSIFTRINNALASAASGDDPQLRLSFVEFTPLLGAKRFWEEVLHHAALQGPRMLAAVLYSIDRRRLDGQAALEFDQLFRKVNTYV
jgi:hypothetical protein